MATKRDWDNWQFDTETKLTVKVKEYLDTLRPSLTYRKISDRYHPGISDIVGCYKGRFFAIELKVGKNTPTTHQKNYIAEVIAAGGEAVVCYTLGEVKEFFNNRLLIAF